MGCAMDGCNALYAPDLEFQRFCRWCQCWYHVQCLDGYQFNPEAATQRLHKYGFQLINDDSLLVGEDLVALAPIQCGGGDVVGPIQVIMQAFGMAELSPISLDNQSAYWAGKQMYACPCKAFL
jgi:hypothetical protein